MLVDVQILVCWYHGSAVRATVVCLADLWNFVEPCWRAANLFKVVPFATGSALLSFGGTRCLFVVVMSALWASFVEFSLGDLSFGSPLCSEFSTPVAHVYEPLMGNPNQKSNKWRHQLRHYRHASAQSTEVLPFHTVRPVVLHPLKWGSPVPVASLTVHGQAHPGQVCL